MSFRIFRFDSLICLICVSVIAPLACCLEFKYHSNEEILSILTNFSQHSGRLRKNLYQIGTTAKGTGLWVLSLTSSPEGKIGTPNIKLIGNMHGDEAVGREILLQFIEHLLENYGKYENITQLLDTTNIHVMPTLNPDGFARTELKCEGDETGRNVKDGFKWVDLNRNFPDAFYDNSKIIKKVPESDAVMKWMENNTFILSVALHGGSFVVKYPFDHGNGTELVSELSLTPDNDVFEFLARNYSKTHRKMSKTAGNSSECPVFADGINNGHFSKSIEGSMGDYNYAYHGCMELTIELGCCRYPSANQLQELWEDNREALVAFCIQANRGVSGQIIDFVTNETIPDANLTIVGRDKRFWSSKNTGEFWRILLPGSYILKVEVNGYNTKLVPFLVGDSTNANPKATFITVALQNSSIYPLPTTTTETPSVTKVAPAEVRSRKGKYISGESEEIGNDITPPFLEMSTSTGYRYDVNVIYVTFLAVNSFI